jgi:hypothetical protein
VIAIIFRRPMVSKKCPSASGPTRFPTAKAIRYSGVFSEATP